jgi:hypothetical protein
VEKRAKLLRAENRYAERLAEDLAGGRLLIYDLGESVWDGVSAIESNGFFDAIDMPPGTPGCPAAGSPLAQALLTLFTIISSVGSLRSLLIW